MDRPVSSGSQKVDWYLKSQPPDALIHMGMPKTNARLQAAGEQQYTADLHEPQLCLHAAYVPVKQAGLEVTGMDTADALKLPGVQRVITAADIPGENTPDWMGLPEPKAISLFVPQGGIA